MDIQGETKIIKKIDKNHNIQIIYNVYNIWHTNVTMYILKMKYAKAKWNIKDSHAYKKNT